MTEAPTPITEISINIENEGKKYEIILCQKSNNLLIISKDLNSFPLKRYEEEFSKNNLNQISRFFMFFNDICKIFVSFVVFCNHQKSGSVSIQSVNNSSSEFSVNIRQILTVFI